MTLEPCDILLFRIGAKSGWFRRLIGWGQRVIGKSPGTADYSHVVFVGPDLEHIYEAKWPKIHNIAFDLIELLKKNPVEVYRLKVPVTPVAVRQIMDYAESQVGKHYDWLALITFGYFQIGPDVVCSQFVWECFISGGIILCPWSNLETPNDIAASDKLQLVTEGQMPAIDVAALEIRQMNDLA